MKRSGKWAKAKAKKKKARTKMAISLFPIPPISHVSFPVSTHRIVPELPQTVEENELAPLPSVFCSSNQITRS